jgi:hypothetical protein
VAAPIGSRFWTTTDMPGEGIADLLVTANPSRAGGYVWTDAVGAYWSLHRGVAAEFRLVESRVWGPPSGLGDGFYTLSEDGPRASRAWFVGDLDGDGRLEPTQTADPARGALTAFRDDGGDHWRVYRVREGSIQPRPMRCGLPASGSDGGFFVANRMDSGRAWALLDFDGNGKRDLVQTSNPASLGARVWSDDVGASWRVWFGG